MCVCVCRCWHPYGGDHEGKSKMIFNNRYCRNFSKSLPFTPPFAPSLPPQGVNDSLGVSIAGGKGSPLGDIPIFIAMIQANGVAAKTHRLKVRRQM